MEAEKQFTRKFSSETSSQTSLIRGFNYSTVIVVRKVYDARSFKSDNTQTCVDPLPNKVISQTTDGELGHFHTKSVHSSDQTCVDNHGCENGPASQLERCVGVPGLLTRMVECVWCVGHDKRMRFQEICSLPSHKLLFDAKSKRIQIVSPNSAIREPVSFPCDCKVVREQ